MSDEAMNDEEMGTKPIAEHEWLQNLVGEWRTVSEYRMGPDKPMQKSEGTESVKSLGGLWSYAESKSPMPNGDPSTAYFALGYDVTLKGYRGCWFGTMTSHLWKYEGELSADGKVMTLNCEGPSFTKDGEMSNYREVIELIDEDHRVTTSYSEDDNGEWSEMMKIHYTRV